MQLSRTLRVSKAALLTPASESSCRSWRAERGQKAQVFESGPHALSPLQTEAGRLIFSTPSTDLSGGLTPLTGTAETCENGAHQMLSLETSPYIQLFSLGPATPPSPISPQPRVTKPLVSHPFLPLSPRYLTIAKSHKVHLFQIMGRQLLHNNS